MRLEEVFGKRVFGSESQKLIVNVMYTGNWVLDHIENLSEKRGLTTQQANILTLLNGYHPEPVTIDKIREGLLFPNPDLSRLIERMRTKDLLHVRTHETDKRKNRVGITEFGKQLIDGIFPEGLELSHLASKLSEEEVARLSVLVQRLRAGIERFKTES